MADMVRKQIYIYKRQKMLLKRLSEQQGVSEAHIVRTAIDREAAAISYHAQIARQAAWEKAHQFMISLREQENLPESALKWRRDEIYDERLARYSTDKNARNEDS